MNFVDVLVVGLRSKGMGCQGSSEQKSVQISVSETDHNVLYATYSITPKNIKVSESWWMHYALTFAVLKANLRLIQ